MDVTVSQYRFYYRSLAIRMVFSLVVVAVVPLFTMAALTRYYFQASYREELFGRLKALVGTHQQRIDNYISERLDALKILGQSIGLDRLRTGTALEDGFTVLREIYGTSLLNVTVLDATDAQVSCAGSCGWQMGEHSRIQWSSNALQSRGYVGDVAGGPNAQPHFIIAVRLDHAGKDWILRAAIHADALNSLLEDLRVGESDRAFIVNRQGVFQTTLSSAPVSGKDFLSGLASPGTQQGQVNVIESKDGGELALVAPLKSTDWALVFVKDTHKAFSGLHHARTSFVSTLLLGFIAIVGVSIIVSSRLAKYVAQVDQEKQLINEQLVRAGQLAALGEMAAGVAHEINNPVAVMVEEAGWIQDLVEDGEESIASNLDEFKSSLDRIRTQGKRCRDITHKLLSFARGIAPVLEPVRLNQLLEDVVALSEQRARLTAIEMRMNLDAELPTVNVSPSEVQQVLLNVINNALDSMEKTGGTIEITSRIQGNYAVVDIADTGPGIRSTNLGKIFEPFFTTKPVGSGTGLGLSICYGIMKKMKGDITVNSEEGKGTTFHLFFPLGELPVVSESMS